MIFQPKLWKTCELYLYKSVVVLFFITFSAYFISMQITDNVNSLLHIELRILVIRIINIVS